MGESAARPEDRAAKSGEEEQGRVNFLWPCADILTPADIWSPDRGPGCGGHVAVMAPGMAAKRPPGINRLGYTEVKHHTHPAPNDPSSL